MPIRRMTLCLLAAAVLAAGGCGDGDQRTRNSSGPATADDAAYRAIAAAQIENALGYSQSVLKTSDNDDVRRFARQVIAERKAQQATLAKLGGAGQSPGVAEASKTLNIPLADLAVSGDGQPLAAPSGDEAYVKAMRSNLNGSLRAAKVESDGGDAATKKLAQRILITASSELGQLRSLP